MGTHSTVVEVIKMMLPGRQFVPMASQRISLAGRTPVVPPDYREIILETRKLRRPMPAAIPRLPYFDKINKAQYKYIARDMFLWIFEPGTVQHGIIQKLGHCPLNKTKYEKFSKKLRGQLPRTVLDSFYHRKRESNWSYTFTLPLNDLADHADENKYVFRLAHLLIGAKHPMLMPSLPMQYRTDTVMALIRGIRKDEAFDRMPILADALQDAGFEEGEFLGRLRDPNWSFSLGDWIFRTTGTLEYHNDSDGSNPCAEILP